MDRTSGSLQELGRRGEVIDSIQKSADRAKDILSKEAKRQATERNRHQKDRDEEEDDPERDHE